MLVLNIGEKDFMSPVDVIHVIKDISNIKRDDTHCLTEDLLIEMFVRATLNFVFVWWRGRAYNNTGYHIVPVTDAACEMCGVKQKGRSIGKDNIQK